MTDEFDTEVADSAPDILRAFEDKHLGHDCPRPFGKFERGSGSKFANLPHAHRAHHAALEHLVATETEHAAASLAKDAAEAKLAAAVARVEATGEAMEKV